MHKPRIVVFVLAAALIAAMAVPATAFGALTNEYGMKFAGQDICVSCHDVSYGETTHGHFAQVGADPSADYMWPAGRLGVGEMVEKSDVAFTLGYGTGLREYLVNNEVEAPEPVPVDFTEIQGTNRYETAVNASQEAFDAATTVVVATGASFPDAMGGAALAGAVDGPVLLTASDSVPAIVLDEIDRLGATTVYVIGGEGAVSKAAFDQLKTVAATVERITGTNRYETALAVADKTIEVLGAEYTGGAFLATGANFPDALGASPVMYAEGMPVLLVDPAGDFTLPDEVTDVTILGGTSAVPASVQTELGAKFDQRIQGTNRYATAAAVAEYGVSLGMSWNGVGIATGENFPDALCAGPLLGSDGAVMLLTTSASLSDAAAAKLNANKATISKATFIGGTGALSAYTRNQVKAILTGVTPPASGDTNPFVVPSMEWDPAAPDTWEIGPAGIEFETYGCGNCHHLGWVAQGKKPTVGNFVSTSTTPTTNHWVADPASTAAPAEKYQAGASIQCEVCHGTGTPAGTVGNHFGSFTSNVKILKGAELLDSGVCGQCHGRAEGGSTVGYTPDQNLLQFIDAWDKEDVPTEATWNGGINAATGKAWAFFPNGANRNQKHSYYNEWALSGHAYRGAYMNDRENPRVTPYMANHTGHYNALTNGGTQACAKCHTGEGYTVRKGLTLMEDYDLATEPTGMYGQECVTCHIPHGADTAEGEAVGMAVREPEKTPSQLGVVNTSICEDCHNWELDVEEHEFDATPSKVATPSALTGRGGSFMNHATREVYNGVGMFDVEQAGKFMPGVKCEECHMPATKSDFPSSTGLPRYEDRSWKRYSHSMHIMEPGSAAEWGLAAWGDSCSPCHAGQTQEELQGFIEKWQGDAAAAATTAKAAYDAAWARSSIVGTSSALGYILEEPGANELLARAGWNYQAYNSEGSMGAHNPDYIVAGLEAATKMAKSVGGYFDYVATGAATADLDYVVGSVKNGDDSPAAGAKISYTINGTDTYTVIADANGNFSFLYDALDSVTSVKWLRCADPVADIEWIAVP